MTAASVDALLAAHAHVHVALEDALYAAMDALMDVPADVARARAHVDAFARLLAAHMQLEDDVVMPVYAAKAPAEGAGRVDHVEGDHTILRRHVETLTTLVAQLDVGDRRRMLEALPPFYRALGTLEHHTAREQTYVYPAFARTQPHDVDALVRSLQVLISRA